MLWVIPNIFTLGRLALTVVLLSMILYLPRVQEADRWWFIDVAFVIFLVAALTDIIDGIVARRLNVVSKFGRMMDPLVDKVLVCGAFVCFAVIREPVLFGFQAATMAFIRWSVAVVLVAREVYVTILRHIAEARGVNFAATFSGKIKMFLQSFAIGTVLIKAAHVRTALWGHWFATAVVAAMLVITVVSGISATRRPSWRQAVS